MGFRNDKPFLERGIMERVPAPTAETPWRNCRIGASLSSVKPAVPWSRDRPKPSAGRLSFLSRSTAYSTRESDLSP